MKKWLTQNNLVLFGTIFIYSLFILTIFQNTPARDCYNWGYASCNGPLAKTIAVSVLPGYIFILFLGFLASFGNTISVLLQSIVNALVWFLVAKFFLLLLSFRIKERPKK